MIHYRVFAGNGPELLGVRDAELDHLVVRTSWGVKFENEMAAAMAAMMIRGFRFRKRKEEGWLGLARWMVGWLWLRNEQKKVRVKSVSRQLWAEGMEGKRGGGRMRGTANLGKLKGTLKSFCYSKVEYGIWRNGTEREREGLGAVRCRRRRRLRVRRPL